MADQERVGFAGDAVAARLQRSFPLASVVGMDDIKEALLLGSVRNLAFAGLNAAESLMPGLSCPLKLPSQAAATFQARSMPLAAQCNGQCSPVQWAVQPIASFQCRSHSVIMEHTGRADAIRRWTTSWAAWRSWGGAAPPSR